MSSFSNFLGGVSDSLGINKALNTPADQVGQSVGNGLKDLFSAGISYKLNDLYGVPTGDPHQVVEKRNGRTPAVVAGQTVPVKSATKTGSAPVSLIPGVTNHELIIASGAVIALMVLLSVVK